MRETILWTADGEALAETKLLAAMVFLTTDVTNQKVLEYTVRRLSAAPLVCGSCAENVNLAEDRAPRLRIAHRLLTLRHEHEDVQPLWSGIVEKVRSDAVLAEAALRLVRP